jgi:hypothetical protein
LAKYIAFAMPSFTKAIARCKINDLRQILHSISHANTQTPQNKRLVDLASFADGQECHAPLWKFLPVFAVGFALPFAKRGECASCKNAQHLSCQPSRRVIPSGDIRPAFALPIPSRYTPRYRIAILPAVSPLPARLRAFYGHPRALFSYRL